MGAIQFLAIVLLLAADSAAAQNCKCTPADECWPTTSDWSALNDTLSGRLIKTEPLASVCYPSEPDYDARACDEVLANWAAWSSHSSDPISAGVSNDIDEGCYPIYANGTSILGDADAGRRGCSRSSYPPYVVNATEAVHVQAALTFAEKHNLRLNIKNTGHGGHRTVSHGSLSIWTHHMKNFEFTPDFQPRCTVNSLNGKAQAAATLGAGIQGGEVLDLLAHHNMTTVTGTNSDVGLVGWATGGGHGFLTGSYGQGADNILEATLVTPGGEVIIANQCQNNDIYWAIRGGGGGTYGVILSMTVKAYPMPSVQLVTYTITARNGTTVSAWWDFVAGFHAILPQIQDSGLHGYWSIQGLPLTMGGTLGAYDTDKAAVEKAMSPMAAYFEDSSSVVNATWSIISMATYSEFIEMVKEAYPEGDGASRSAAASRLISERVVMENTSALTQILEEIGPGSSEVDSLPPGSISMSGSMTLSNKPVDNALPPGWRRSVVHLITKQAYDDSTPAHDVDKIQDDFTYTKLDALRSLDADAPAYLNEANRFEPGWQWSFFGPKYARLREIKDRLGGVG
ncbi:hypothetical protein FQN54_001075 [Arachnomyces sp. PD_36]|nr:hypothetical protein FQN54_001075 [Arachnomyces sp. PD_36]